MRSVLEWQKLFAGAMNKKFSPSSQEKRIAFMFGELNDIKTAREVEVREVHTSDHRYAHVDERIAGLLANVFELAEQRGTNLEKELQQALDWFNNPDTKASSEN